jgi:hypothetical protein
VGGKRGKEDEGVEGDEGVGTGSGGGLARRHGGGGDFSRLEGELRRAMRMMRCVAVGRNLSILNYEARTGALRGDAYDEVCCCWAEFG